MAALTHPDVARGLVLERVAPLRAESVPLVDALDRVLAADVESAEPVPPFDNSAMDGFAVRAADTQAAAERPVSLAVVDESRAGAPAERRVERGEAIRISTGAALPAGADAVVRIEDVVDGGGTIELREAVTEGRDLRRAGHDMPAGTRALAAGSVVGPAEVGVLAAAGASEVACARRPEVAVLTTGDELLGADEPPRPGAIRNTSSFALPAQARRAGARVPLVETVRDDLGATIRAIERALAHDVVVVCGGVSVGPHDHVKPALAELGVEEVFWGVALRPGKPTWFGCGERGTLVFGLPGNPVSAMVTFHMFVRPALAALAGADPSLPRAAAVLARPYAKEPGRMHAVRCHVEPADGRWHAVPTGDQGSHILTSMLGTDALALIDAERGDVAAGDEVTIEFLWGR